MDFELTDEQRLIKDTAREFTDKEIVKQSRENARNHHFDVELVGRSPRRATSARSCRTSTAERAWTTCHTA